MFTSDESPLCGVSHAVDSPDGLPGARMKGFPDFGHNMLKYWAFKEGYINMNHGSYGSTPRPVIEWTRQKIDEIESSPDRFMRRTFPSQLDEARGILATMVGAKREEVVIMSNVTIAINSIVHQIDWQEGDVIVCYTHTYGAIAQTLKHICDKHPSVSLVQIPISFPLPHADFVQQTETVIEQYNIPLEGLDDRAKDPQGRLPGQRIRMLVCDSIASVPGVICPWEELVSLCRKYGVLSLVDGAHSIGQHKVDLSKAEPDFFVSNCHKWFMSARAAALVYVPTRNQYRILSPFPTSQFYESKRYPSEGIAKKEWSFQKQFEWMGTIDWTSFLSIIPAAEFRKSIGGEDRIMTYCHGLAIAGGKRLAMRWNSSVLGNADLRHGELTAAMVNVEMPFIPNPVNPSDEGRMMRDFEDGFLDNNAFAVPYRHDGRWWIRLSAQVFNDLSDFDRIAIIVERIGAIMITRTPSSTMYC